MLKKVALICLFCYYICMSELKQILAENLVALRKSKKLTQGELSEQVAYSDKTISKWENGDAVPDIETLHQLAVFYGVTIDDLISKPAEQLVNGTNKVKIHNIRNKLIITLLAVMLIWSTATVIYVQAKIINDVDLWLSFIWAIPLSFIVLLVFNNIWGNKRTNYLIISLLCWTLLCSVHLQFLNYNFWPIYFLGIPFQISVILWSQLKSSKKSVNDF